MPKRPESRRLLAVDFGLASMGVAVGEEVGASVRPLGAVPARSGVPQWQRLDEWMRQWQPQLLILGLPLNMDGSDSAMAQRARRFARALEERYVLPCELSDERLSTRSARERWDGKSKDELQALSAAVILDDWLERQRSDDCGAAEGSR